MDATIGYGEPSAPPAAPRGSGPGATRGYDERAPTPTPTETAARTPTNAGDSLAATLAATSALAPAAGDGALAATLAAPSIGDTPARPVTTLRSFVRTTVLPRLTPDDAATGVQWSAETHPRYERLGALGEGGVGEVALVVDHDIQRRVAVKRLRPEQRSETAVLRFADEVRVVGQLEHPGIVPVHDVGIDEDGQHYIVMRYVAGETLESVIQKLREANPAYTRRFTFEYRARICLAVLEAVGFAHAQGIIHRDLKPANVMVGPHGEVTIMDWGLAKPAGAPERADRDDAAERAPGAAPPAPKSGARMLQTQQGALLGTPLYMSPEQAMGFNDALDARSDVYALGVMFFELFALHPTLAGRTTVADVLVGVTTEEFVGRRLGMEFLRAGAPCEFGDWLDPALHHDPAKRYPDAQAMARALKSVLDGEIPVKCHVTLTKRTLRGFDHWINAHGWLFAGAFGLAALGSLYGLFSLARGIVGLVR